MTTASYIIRGGIEGFDRLKVLARVMHGPTSALFERVGVGNGMHCLDVGCGGGDVSFELGRRVGSTGRVVGADLDEVKLGLARKDAEALRMPHVEFRKINVLELDETGAYDLVYARFLLTHLTDPASFLVKLRGLLRPGGLIVVEDIDFTGTFCHPPSAAHSRYVELYTQTVQSKGADPNIGPRLPELLTNAGFARVQVSVTQPVAVSGEIKLIPALTMKTIADAVTAAGHASAAEIEGIVAELMALAEDSTTLIGMPRVVQAWGRA